MMRNAGRVELGLRTGRDLRDEVKVVPCGMLVQPWSPLLPLLPLSCLSVQYQEAVCRRISSVHCIMYAHGRVLPLCWLR